MVFKQSYNNARIVKNAGADHASNSDGYPEPHAKDTFKIIVFGSDCICHLKRMVLLRVDLN